MPKSIFMFSKTNLPSTLTTFLLILTVGILFWYGENKIKEAENINSTVIAWENLSNSYPLCEVQRMRDKGGHPPFREKEDGGFLCDNISNLNLTIQNITPKKNTYTISWLINKEEIDSQTIIITNQGKKIISPTKKVLTKLTELSKNNRKVLYQVKINWNSKTEILGKWLKH